MPNLFIKKLNNLIKKNQSLICVGLDTDYEKIPDHLRKGKTETEAIFQFNKKIIENTHDLVCTYKPNIAFYEASGLHGLKALEKTIKFLKDDFPEIPVILDAKKNDIASTAEMSAKYVFDILGVDAVTLNPYLGIDSLRPYFGYKEKYSFVLCKTSNPSSADFQDLELKGRKFYEIVALKIREWNKTYGNVGLVAGVTYPEAARKIREIVGDEVVFLVPGLGAQGGKAEDIKLALNLQKNNVIVNVGRSVIYASKNKKFYLSSRLELKKIKSSF